MQRENGTALRIGAWCVRPASGQISRGDETVRVEARTMRLLLYLAERAGDVVSIDELLDHVWAGVTVSPDSVYQAVASLRRILGDDPKQPAYIATVTRLGYRMVADVAPWTDDVPPDAPRSRPALFVAVVSALTIALLAASWWFLLRTPHKVEAARQPPKSIAVLPFLDLTDKMNHEIFVDGMTEELVDRLSRIPGVRVPPARTSLAFKGKHATIAGVARTLGTTYVLDGSVRKSGSMLRVDAQLVRADTGFVVWAQTYDRPAGDLVTIENDIAAEVARSLEASVGGQ